MRTLGILFFFWLALGSALNGQTIGQALPDNKGLMIDVQGEMTLNVRLVDRRLQLIFVDDKGLVTECPFSRVIVHLRRTGIDVPEMHLTMRPVSGLGFVTHPRIIPPPDSYKVRILLYPSEKDDAGRIFLPEMPFIWTD
ncbi:MAG: hypothetical protein WC360_03580 [Opitutales bacterium]|jgi:hypothetical protein